MDERYNERRRKRWTEDITKEGERDRRKRWRKKEKRVDGRDSESRGKRWTKEIAKEGEIDRRGTKERRRGGGERKIKKCYD